MDSGLAGLVGALIGATAGLGGNIFVTWLQAKQEQKRWMRDKRAEAYANAIKSLNETLYLKSEIGVGLGPIRLESMTGQANQKWWNSINEAIYWLSHLYIYCSDFQKPVLGELIRELRRDFNQLTSLGLEYRLEKHDNTEILGDVVESLLTALEVVENSAREDLGTGSRRKPNLSPSSHLSQPDSSTPPQFNERL